MPIYSYDYKKSARAQYLLGLKEQQRLLKEREPLFSLMRPKLDNWIATERFARVITLLFEAMHDKKKEKARQALEKKNEEYFKARKISLVDDHALFIANERILNANATTNDRQIAELSDTEWRNQAASCLVPVAMTEEEKLNGTETHFKVVNQEILNACTEYETQCNNQLSMLQNLIGGNLLNEWGLFRSTVQNLIERTRTQIYHTRCNSIRSTFNAVAEPYFRGFVRPVAATIIFNERHYRLPMMAPHKQRRSMADSFQFWTSRVFSTW